MTREKIDLKDRMIIYELEKNARTSITEIAKKINISKQLTSYKIKQLEKRGIIKGYTAIIDNSRLGLITFRIYIRFQNLTEEEKERIISELTTFPEIPIIQTIDGKWDLAFLIVTKKLQNFHNTWHKILTQYKPVINNYLISIYSPIFHMTRNFLSPTENYDFKIKILGSEEKTEYDENDISILKELAPNSRIPTTNIARKINRPATFVINRIKKLEKKGIIQGYRPILDWNKLGYIYYKIELTLNDFTKYDNLIRYCNNQKYIFQIDQTISPFDFEIELYAKTKEHFREIMNELQEQFPKTIKYYDYFTLIDTYKEEFFPHVI